MLQQPPPADVLRVGRVFRGMGPDVTLVLLVLGLLGESVRR